MPKYEIVKAQPWYEGTNLVCDSATRRILAGVGHNQHRAWAFPLNTPRGLNVLQEYAFDHAFHNGLFVGQGMVSLMGGELAQFWATTPDWRAEPHYPIYENIGQLRYGSAPQIALDLGEVRFTYQTVWQDDNGTPMFDEERVFRVWSTEDAVLCELSSRKRATYGQLEFRKTKYGSICARVQPQLLPALGGQILAGRDSQIYRGLADEVAMDKPSDFVAYENNVPGLGRFGLCLLIRENSASFEGAEERTGPWFVRDYGVTFFNPTIHRGISLSQGEEWVASLRAVAYDGALTLERVAAWGMES